MSRFKSEQREYVVSENIQIYIKDKPTIKLDIDSIFKKIQSAVPPHLMTEIDMIFIGMFEEFEKTDTNALYKDGAIYISNQQESPQDIVDDIVHEMAHSLETPYGHYIYADGKLEKEFLAKREKLYDILVADGETPKKSLFENPEYSLELDEYLYKEVGYDKLNLIAATYSLFVSAYAATAMREYFASGFEYYYLDDRTYLAEISPELFLKIEGLNNNE